MEESAAIAEARRVTPPKPSDGCTEGFELGLAGTEPYKCFVSIPYLPAPLNILRFTQFYKGDGIWL